MFKKQRFQNLLISSLNRFFIAGGIALLSGCDSSTFTASNTSDSSVVASGEASTQVSIHIKTFQNLPKKSWITDDSKNVYTSDNHPAYTGVCSRGIATLNFYVNGVNVGSAGCGLSGQFSWIDSTSIADGPQTIRITPVGKSGKEYSGADFTQNLIVDSVVPAAPIITSPASPIALSSSLIVSATAVSANTVKIIASVTPTSSSFTYPNFTAAYTLVNGHTTTYTFYAQSKSGLTSPPAVVTVSYLAAISLSAFDSSGVAIATPVPDASGSSRIFTSLTSSPYLMTSNPMTSSDGNKLKTGYNQYAY